MKDKILQITGTGEYLVALTQTGRLLRKGMGKGQKWTEITPKKELLELEDIPRFTFGKFKGEPIVEADSSYLDWCRDNIDGFMWKLVDGKLIEDLPF